MSIKEYVVSHIVNLIKIKSVVTLALTAAFVILALKGEIAPDQFLAIFTMVIGFYFGTQKDKSEAAEGGGEKQAAESPEGGDGPRVYTPESGEIVYDAVYAPSDRPEESGESDGSN